MSKRRDRDEGNSVGSATALTRILVRTGEMVARADDLVDKLADEDVFVLDIRFKLGGSVGEGWLVVVRGDTPEGRVVAFHSAPTFTEALVGVLDRIMNKSLKWKEDRPYGT